MTATRPAAASGRISGLGLDMANTIGSVAILRRSSAVMRSGALTPMKTSAPGRTSERVPLICSGLVISEKRRFTSLRSVRPRWMAPWRSVATMLWTPAFIRILAMATPAAPAPAITTRMSPMCLPTILRAFSRAARVTTAVPCWSSWNTGMSSRASRRSSISKQEGAAMSSRLMPPNTGAMRTTVSTMASTRSWSGMSAGPTSRQMGKPSTPAKFLNSRALPSITGRAASGPMSPSPRTAVPSVTMATMFFLMVSSCTRSGRCSISVQTRATPGV